MLNESSDQESILQIKEQFDRGFNFYKKGEFLKAKELLLHCLEMFPEDQPSRILAGRCESFAKKKPKGWSGAVELS